MKTKYLSKFLFIFLLIVFIFQNKYCLSNSNENTRNIISFIGHLNFDRVNDTVISSIVNEKNLLPKYILWGKGDERKCGEFHSDSISKEKTVFIYPDQSLSSCNYSFFDFNSDNVYDILLSFNNQDTLRPRIIFGQNEIDLIDTIFLSQIVNDQTSPFTSMILKNGNGLKNPSSRDASGDTSYEINPIPVNLNPNFPQNKKSINYIDFHNIKIISFPNPALNNISIRISNANAGKYLVQFNSIYDYGIVKKFIDIDGESDFMINIDVSVLTAGYYMVILLKDNVQISANPLIIIK